MIVGDPCQPILTPVVGTRPCLVVREVIPRIAVVAVVFTNSAPLALAQIGTPLLPLDSGVLQSELLDTFLFIDVAHLDSPCDRCFRSRLSSCPLVSSFEHAAAPIQ